MNKTHATLVPAPRRIMLADDDRALQEAFGLLARQKRFDVIAVTAGTDVMRRAIESQPELIVLEVSFPDADGRDILALLKSEPATASIPVLVWSGLRRDPESDRRISLTLGAEDFVEKSDVQSLLKKVERVLLRLDGGSAVFPILR